jgi:AraC family transcriptional regulator of adaptative response/methylated-DNA-[protein]-cysteine methyltransferase
MRNGNIMSDEACWSAVVRRDRQADGRLVYAVKTTGIFCRPSCAARQALRKNVIFFETAAEAVRAGFRPCRRCLPDKPVQASKHAAVVLDACRRMETAGEMPSLEQLAAGAQLSVAQFHRVFKEQTGLTPKAYAGAQRAARARREVGRQQTVTAAVYRAGFGSSGRFYAGAAQTLGMAPRRYQAGGAGVKIQFAVAACSLGALLVAASDIGLCAISLGDDPEALVRTLQDRFGQAELVGGDAEFERWVQQVVGLVERPELGLDLPLDIRGTAFQHRVWEMLRAIPCGQTRSYAELARELGMPRGARAVATACAANVLAVAIPCHRVVRTDGGLSGYRWGVERKGKLLECEMRNETMNDER